MQTKWEEHYANHKYFHLDPHPSLNGFVSKARSRNIEKVLDLGCGAGQDLLFLAEKGFDVEGVDFSPAAATNAEDLLQSKNLAGKVYVDNLFDRVTTFKTGEYKAIIAINSLEYTDELTFESAILEVSRILDEKGLFLLVVSSKDSKIQVEVPEQLFFTEEKLVSAINGRFNILDFTLDGDKNFVVLLEKKF